MQSFYICHCGYTSDNHMFRHEFEKKCKVVRTKKKGGEKFILNAEDFKLNSKTICSVPQCSAKKEIHSSDMIHHEFQPVEKFYRHIKLALPPDTVCNYTDPQGHRCDTVIEKHLDIGSHKFKTIVTVLNLKNNDIINVEDPFDYDISIDYGSLNNI